MWEEMSAEEHAKRCEAVSINRLRSSEMRLQHLLEGIVEELGFDSLMAEYDMKKVAQMLRCTASLTFFIARCGKR